MKIYLHIEVSDFVGLFSSPSASLSSTSADTKKNTSLFTEINDGNGKNDEDMGRLPLICNSSVQAGQFKEFTAAMTFERKAAETITVGKIKRQFLDLYDEECRCNRHLTSSANEASSPSSSVYSSSFPTATLTTTINGSSSSTSTAAATSPSSSTSSSSSTVDLADLLASHLPKVFLCTLSNAVLRDDQRLSSCLLEEAEEEEEEEEGRRHSEGDDGVNAVDLFLKYIPSSSLPSSSFSSVLETSSSDSSVFVLKNQSYRNNKKDDQRSSFTPDISFSPFHSVSSASPSFSVFSYRSLTIYSFEDFGNCVVVRIPLVGVHTLASSTSSIKKNITATSCEILVEGLGSYNYRFAIRTLHSPVVPDECSLSLRTDRMTLRLKKARNNDVWEQLYKIKGIGED